MLHGCPAVSVARSTPYNRVMLQIVMQAALADSKLVMPQRTAGA